MAIEAYMMEAPVLKTGVVIATAEAGAYVGNTVAGLTDPHSVKFVPWGDVERRVDPLVLAYMKHKGLV